tara:strand:- start:3993 stop:4838 length:846 start_codon:yes stop_codon:yes gene_type:complete
MILEYKEHYSYDFILNTSNNLDRTQYKLQDSIFNIINKIKNKLKIENNYNNTFNSTFIKKSNEEYMNNLFKYLNKLSDKTYDKFSSQIIELIKNNTHKEINKTIIDKFFDIIITNSIYCNLYAKIFNLMINEDNSFLLYFNNKIELYLNNFKNIKYVSSNDNYDEYCKYVKHIDSLKNFTLFLIESYNNDICDLNKIVNIIIFLQENIIENINNEENLKLNENYCLNIHIIIKNLINKLNNHDKWNIIINNLNTIYNTDGFGKNKRIQFNIMDINDIIDKL